MGTGALEETAGPDAVGLGVGEGAAGTEQPAATTMASATTARFTSDMVAPGLGAALGDGAENRDSYERDRKSRRSDRCADADPLGDAAVHLITHQ